MRIVVSSRKSDLARIQAFRVVQALKEKRPHLEIEYRFQESLGDKNLTDPLWKMPEKGVFTEDFLDDLVTGKTDLVVHSWKDLPIEKRAHTQIAATLARADARDLLLIRKDRWPEALVTKSVTIFSSSPRRAYNLEPFLKEALPGNIEVIHFESVRGNVPTRIQKMLSSQVDGLVVAKAALDRLLLAKEPEFHETQNALLKALSQCLVMILPLEQNPTASAQGALAIEVHSQRQDLLNILREINCVDTFEVVTAEREILKGYGGGCHQKVGASVRKFDYGTLTSVKALTDQNEIVDRFEFVPRRPVKKTTAQNIFPESLGGSWFERIPLDVEVPEGPLWIAKAEALPAGVQIPISQIVWTSGWDTWKRLAKRGVWVSGSSESLGENYGPGTFSLWKDLNWTKLTHSDSPAGTMTTLATYSLKPSANPPSLSGKTHFYWMSGSSFLRALKLNPWIKDCNHFCGPGNTSELLAKYVDVQIYPNFHIWKEHVVL